MLALLSGMLRLGILAYGISFLAYGIYLFGALATHVQDVLVDPSTRKNKMFVTINTGVFVFFLLLFGALSLKTVERQEIALE